MIPARPTSQSVTVLHCRYAMRTIFLKCTLLQVNTRDPLKSNDLYYDAASAGLPEAMIMCAMMTHGVMTGDPSCATPPSAAAARAQPHGRMQYEQIVYFLSAAKVSEQWGSFALHSS